MTKLETCSTCGQQHKVVIEQEIKFIHNGDIFTVNATRLNDAFYEITQGKLKGNLIHIFDVLKS